MATEEKRSPQLEWYYRNIDKARQISRESAAKARAAMTLEERRAKWQKERAERKAKNPEGLKANNHAAKLRQYGLTPEDYEGLLVQQGFCCAICGVHASELEKALCVDHDHDTHKVRGLLCSECNQAIGKLQDDPELCFQAGKYLQDNQ